MFLLVWQWNGLLMNVGSGFDAGVQNMETFTALSSTINYGKDLVVSPYGPLDWLYKGVYIPFMGRSEAIFKAVTINVLYALVRVMLIAQFWEKAKSKEQRLIALIASLSLFIFAFPQREHCLLDLCVLLAAVFALRIHMNLAVENRSACNNRTVYLLAAGVGVLLAVPQLAKFSYFAFAGALIIILSAVFLFRKRYMGVAVLICSYSAATVGLWILCGEKAAYLVSYFYAMLHFVQGYSEVMAVGFDNYEFALRDFILALLIGSFYAVTLFWLFIRDKMQAMSWLVITPYFFLIFKEAFVRSDSHTASFYKSIVFVAVYLLLVVVWEFPVADARKKKFLYVNSCTWGILLILLLLPELTAGGWNAKNMLFSDAKTLISEESYAARKEELNAEARLSPEYGTLLSDIESYPDKTLGMLSGEQSFFLAYDLMDRFQLNPIVSLWENFNSYSENLSAEHYYGEDAPEILLYKPEPLDGGYFPFRMGTVLQSLLENYRVESVDENGYLVLSHNEFGKHEFNMLGEPLTAWIGEPVTIPRVDSAFVFMKVDWSLTPLGKLASFVLKPPESWVTVNTKEGARDFRFFRTLANSGLYVSDFVDGSQDLAELINGSLSDNTVESITLHGNSLFYQKYFKVSFYAVPRTPEQIAYQQRSVVTSAFSAELPEGEYQYFYARDGMFNGYQMDAGTISSDQTQVVGSIPSQGWNILRLDFPPFIHEYDILSIDCDGKACEIDGANDTEVTKTENGWHIKTGEYDPFITLRLVE